MKDSILAKKEVTDEIKEHAGSDHILPSEIHSQSQKDHEFQKDKEFQGSDRLKGEMDYGQATDEVVAGAHQQSIVGMIKEKVTNAAIVVKETLLNKDKEIHEERLAGLGAIEEGAMKDEVVKDHILAKKEINAEIKEHAGSSDHILPSEVTTIHDGRLDSENKFGSDRLKGDEDAHQQTLREMISSKVSNAANAVKETLQNLH